MTKFYIDGSCCPTPTGKRAVVGACYASRDNFRVQVLDGADSTDAELGAAILALNSTDQPIRLFTDCSLVVQVINRRSTARWQRVIAQHPLVAELRDLAISKSVTACQIPGHGPNNPEPMCFVDAISRYMARRVHQYQLGAGDSLTPELLYLHPHRHLMTAFTDQPSRCSTALHTLIESRVPSLLPA